MSKIKTRNPSLDIIRILAFCSVVGVHFFLNTSFYRTTIHLPVHFLMIIIRTACLVCVPLFMLLTGYLMNKKALNKKYYIGIIKTIGIYFLASLACYISKTIISGTRFDILTFVINLFSFKAAKYSWYIEMYIGLFLLVPFLNLIYNNLTSQKQKKVLVFTLIILTALPSILNVYDLTTLLPFLSHIPSTGHNKIIPDWWTSLYPITYYYIGAYLKEYKPKANFIQTLFIYLFTLLGFSAYCLYRSNGHNFFAGKFQEWGALPVVILSISLFHMINCVKMDKVPTRLNHILSKLSDLTLCAYLVSEIFDSLIYKYLNNNVTNILEEQFKYFLPCILTIIVLSLITSLLINFIYQTIYNTVLKTCNHIKAKKLSGK